MIRNKKLNDILTSLENSNLTLEERVVIGKRMFDIEGRNRIFNFLYREDILIKRYNLTRPDIHNITGFDTKEYELKSKSVKIKNDKLHIPPSFGLGLFSRAHKPNVNDKQDVMCGVFDEDEQLICVFTVKNDDNFQKFKEDRKQLLLSKKAQNKNVHDAAVLRYGDLINYKMNFKYEHVTKDVHIEFTNPK